MLALLLACAVHAPVATVATLDAPQPGDWHLDTRESVILPPGESLEIFAAAGPGRIERMWMTLGDVEDGPLRANLRDGRLRFWWDGAAEPAVDVPVGDFFGVGHGVHGVLQADPIQTANHGMAAYWPMPFADGARVVYTNEGPEAIRVFAQVNWSALPRRAVSPLRFQASWRRNEALEPGTALVADIRGRGHYVGTVLALSPTRRSWWGEGNDVYVVDGRTVMGTGSEDWLNQAWCSLAPSSSRAGVVNQKGRLLTLYRFHVPDVVRFAASLKVGIQQRGFLHVVRDDDVAATAFWYQAPPLTPVPALPPAAERQVVPVVPDGKWTMTAQPRPVDVLAAAAAAGVPATDRTGAPRLDLHQLRPGAHWLAGVQLQLGGCGGRSCGVQLADQRLPLPVPEGAAALYLLTTAEGTVGEAAFTVRAGETTTPFVIGEHTDAYNDPFPVPFARGVTLGEDGMGLQGAYVGVVPLPPGTRAVELVGAAPNRAVVWAAAAGALPADWPR